MYSEDFMNRVTAFETMNGSNYVTTQQIESINRDLEAEKMELMREQRGLVGSNRISDNERNQEIEARLEQINSEKNWSLRQTVRILWIVFKRGRWAVGLRSMTLIRTRFRKFKSALILFVDRDFFTLNLCFGNKCISDEMNEIISLRDSFRKFE